MALAAPVAAQEFQAQPQNPPPQGGGPLPGLDNGDMTPGEIQQLFDAYLVMEAQQALQLTDQQYPQFLTRLQDAAGHAPPQPAGAQPIDGAVAAPHQSAPRRSAVDEAEIKERLTALQELESRTAAEMRKAYNALDEVLDVRQQARFRVFEEQIERRKIELLMRARQQNRANSSPIAGPCGRRTADLPADSAALPRPRRMDHARRHRCSSL